MRSSIRTGTIHDHEAVSRIAAELSGIHARALPERFRHATDPMPLDYYRSLVEGADASVIVAERAGGVVGYEVLRLQETPPIEILKPRRFVFISDLAVAEAARGQGIGRILVDAALAWAREQGASSIELGVYEFNESAIAFYEHLGFGTIKRTMMLPVD